MPKFNCQRDFALNKRDTDMKHKQLYEFRDTDGAGNPEVVMSRFDEGNSDLSNPNSRITLYSTNDNWTYDASSPTNDADGDGDHDEEDASYYLAAANLITAMATLSPRDESKRLYDRILMGFSDSPATDVSILHYRKGNRDLNRPDVIVVASNPDYLGSYRTIKGALDADGDGDIDSDDERIYKKLASTFASMKYLKP